MNTPCNKTHLKHVIGLSLLLSLTSLHTQAYEYQHPPSKADQDILAQVQALYGLDEETAIHRLAAEDQAAEQYSAIRSASLESYAAQLPQ